MPKEPGKSYIELFSVCRCWSVARSDQSSEENISSYSLNRIFVLIFFDRFGGHLLGAILTTILRLVDLCAITQRLTQEPCSY